MPLLTIRDLSVFYDKSQALKGMSLDVGDKETVSVLGANGAGKTTLFRSISGLSKTVFGTIMLEGKEILGLSAPQIARAGIAHVPQGGGLFPEMSVLLNLRMGAYCRRDRQIEQDLKLVYNLFPKLKERRGQSAGSLSGGERQMVAIGRALMAKPRLLLMDEPSLGLAPILVEELARSIVSVCRSGVGILLAEQNTTLALSVAHRGYVLEAGAIVLEGTTQKLKESEMIQKAFLGL